MRFALFVTLLTLPAFAQSSKERDSCFAGAMTQRAMDMCASEEFERADAELNAVYQKVLAAAPDTDAEEKVRTAERTWISYRDQYMEAMFPAKEKQRTYGTKYATDYGLALARLTWIQVDALKQLLAQYSGPK